MGKLAKNRGFFNLKKNFVINFHWILFYNENLYYLLCSCTNPIFGKNLVPEIYANILSANLIAKSFISPEHINETTSFFAFCYKFTQIKMQLKIFRLGMVKNECGKTVHGALKMNLSQKGTDGIKWVGGNPEKLKVDSMIWSGCGEKWPWPFSSWERKICCFLVS